MSKVKNLALNAKTKAEELFQKDTNLNTVKAVVATGIAFTPNALAAVQGADSILSTVLGYVGDIFVYLGIFLLVLSIGNLISALKQEDAERQSKQITMIIISCVLIAIKPIMNAILSATGQGVSVK